VLARPPWRRTVPVRRARCSPPATRRSTRPRTSVASRRRPIRTRSRRFAELRQRIQKCLGFLESVQAKDLAGAEERKFSALAGREWLRRRRLPAAHRAAELLFHATMAYAILRHNGVDLGRWNYIGSIPTKGRLRPDAASSPAGRVRQSGDDAAASRGWRDSTAALIVPARTSCLRRPDAKLGRSGDEQSTSTGWHTKGPRSSSSRTESANGGTSDGPTSGGWEIYHLKDRPPTRIDLRIAGHQLVRQLIKRSNDGGKTGGAGGQPVRVRRGPPAHTCGYDGHAPIRWLWSRRRPIRTRSTPAVETPPCFARPTAQRRASGTAQSIGVLLQPVRVDVPHTILLRSERARTDVLAISSGAPSGPTTRRRGDRSPWLSPSSSPTRPPRSALRFTASRCTARARVLFMHKHWTSMRSGRCRRVVAGGQREPPDDFGPDRRYTRTSRRPSTSSP